MNKDDLFIDLNFNELQLDAIRMIYSKYFEQEMPTSYSGTAIIAIWKPGAVWKMGQGPDLHHRNFGITNDFCVHDDLWHEFSNLLPFMSPIASITKMPANSVMFPHVDRAIRPHAIYFPIRGCSEQCVSEYYNLPKKQTENSQFIHFFPPSDFSYSICDNAVLTNVHEWHSVRNNSSMERIAFGWNFKDTTMSFNDCKNILKDLGYMK